MQETDDSGIILLGVHLNRLVPVLERGYQAGIDPWTAKLINPGEEVIVIAPEDKMLTENEAEASEEARQLSIYALSNPQKWWRFFFNR